MEITYEQVSAVEYSPKVRRDSNIDMKDNDQNLEVQKEPTSEGDMKDKEPTL